MAFNNRIKEARISASMTQADLAEALGVAKSTISSYEIGDRDPPPNVILKIINILKVDANFLFQDEMSGKEEERKVSPQEYGHMRKYRVLDAHGKKVVDLVTDEEYSRCEAERKKHDPVEQDHGDDPMNIYHV